MSVDDLTIAQATIRGTDSNSLLRMYDAATAIFNQAPRQRDRDRAERVIRRIGKELEKRNIGR